MFVTVTRSPAIATSNGNALESVVHSAFPADVATDSEVAVEVAELLSDEPPVSQRNVPDEAEVDHTPTV